MAEASNWPAGLSDEDAVVRLQTVLIRACEGNRDVTNDRDYRDLRGPLIKKAAWSDVVPPFVRAHRDLASFWAYIKQISPHWEPRRQHVWEGFRPLFERLEGRSTPPVRSGNWTGRRSPAQQAQIVLALAPEALRGVDMLLEEQSRALHNGGPADPEQLAAIDALRVLHRELGALIELAEAGQPLGRQLGQLKSVARDKLKWIASPYGLSLGSLPLAGASTVLGCGVFGLINAITKDAVTSAAIASASTGVFGADAIAKRKRQGPNGLS